MDVFRHFNTYNTGLFGETFSIKCDVLTCVKIHVELHKLKCHRPVYGKNVYGKNACIWEFASRRVAGFYNTRNTLTQNTLRKVTLFLFFGVFSAWAKFMIKQYYKSIGVKKKRKQDVIAFVNTVTQFIHRGSYAHIVTVVGRFREFVG
jgi:hypothetical protein